MTPAIHVLDGQRRSKTTFRELLEERARHIVGGSSGFWTPTETSSLERELALTLDHLEHARALDERTRRELLDLELYVHTRLMQLWPGKTQHLPYLWRETDSHKLAERDRLQERLLWIEQERRRLAAIHEERLRPLHDRLLLLLNRHVYLSREWTSKH